MQENLSEPYEAPVAHVSNKKERWTIRQWTEEGVTFHRFTTEEIAKEWLKGQDNGELTVPKRSEAKATG